VIAVAPPEDERRTGGGPHEPEQHSERCRLPGAVWAHTSLRISPSSPKRPSRLSGRALNETLGQLPIEPVRAEPRLGR
jgi:hypothetical protein